MHKGRERRRGEGVKLGFRGRRVFLTPIASPPRLVVLCWKNQVYKGMLF